MPPRPVVEFLGFRMSPEPAIEKPTSRVSGAVKGNTCIENHPLLQLRPPTTTAANATKYRNIRWTLLSNANGVQRRMP